MRHKVIIVGGGPVGLSAAICLAYQGIESVLIERYCARPPFASENLRWNGPWLIYRLPKPTHTGQTFVQMMPLEFLDKISAFVPSPRKHRRHYHGVFAPNSPLRKKIIANAQKRPEAFNPQGMQEEIEKVKKVSIGWRMLIARIYEVDPLICSNCGKQIRIISFVTHSEEIRRILKGTIWALYPLELDPPYELKAWDICQLVPGTKDGFPEDGVQISCNSGPDPPHPIVFPFLLSFLKCLYRLFCHFPSLLMDIYKCECTCQQHVGLTEILWSIF